MRYPIPRQFEIPEVVSGYELDPAAGWFWVILPEASTNLCVNPSYETNTTGWAGLSAAISRVSTYQRYGTYSLKVQPTAAVNDGVYLGNSAASLIPTIAGQWYTASFYIRGAGGLPYKCYWADQWGNRLGQEKTFSMPHDWGRITISWYENQTTARRLYITKTNVTNIQPFYIDGVLIENKAYATTYFDGDSVGYVTGVSDFYWTGARHASTSARSAQTLAGGRPVRLKDLGFTLLAIIGLGMAPMKPISQDYGWQDGALYQRMRKPARDFTLAGYVSGATDPERKRNRAQLEAALSPDNVATQQPLTLLYEYTDECGGSFGEVLSIPCVYRGGLEGKTDNLYSEKVPLNFTMFLPLIEKSSEEGASLTYQATVATSDIIRRNADGSFQTIGGVGGSLGGAAVNQILYNPYDGRFYIVGEFTSMNGVANTNGVCAYDPATNTIYALGTGIVGAGSGGLALALASNGDVWAGAHDSTSFGGVANTRNIAKWSITANVWQSVAAAGTSNVGDFVYAIAFTGDGTAFVTGEFSNIGGVAMARIGYFDTAWHAIGTGLDATGYSLTVGLNGTTVYGGGLFTTFNGTTVNYFFKYEKTTATISAIGTGGNAYVRTLMTDVSGDIFMGGNFTLLNGIVCNYLARFNGTQFFPLGSGASSTVYLVTRDKINNVLVVGGIFTTIGGIAINYSAIYNYSSFAFIPFTIPGGTPRGVTAYAASPQGVGLFGWFTNAAGNSTTGATNIITNTGSENASPIVTLTGPGMVYSIRNETTGDALYFNLTLLAGEVATLNLASGNISFISNFRGNILSTILPGSNLATFKLLPGANVISVFVAGTTSAATAVDARWTPQYLGLEH